MPAKGSGTGKVGVLERMRSRSVYAPHPDLPLPCCLWMGVLNSSGYGTVFNGEQRPAKRTIGIHQFAYEHFIGPIPRGKVLDHLCRRRNCWEPTHLEPVTYQENFLRSGHPRAVACVTGICLRGHPLTLGNQKHYFQRGKWRVRCRACVNTAKMDSYFRQQSPTPSVPK